MKFRSFLMAGAIAVCGHAYADYASHQFFHMDRGLQKCMQIASEAAKKSGFSSVQSQDFSSGEGGRQYAVAYGANKDGYSFQFVCESTKGFGYVIVNGSNVDVKNKIRDGIGAEEIGRAHV